MEIILLLILGMIIGFAAAAYLVARWVVNFLDEMFRNWR